MKFSDVRFYFNARGYQLERHSSREIWAWSDKHEQGTTRVYKTVKEAADDLPNLFKDGKPCDWQAAENREALNRKYGRFAERKEHRTPAITGLNAADAISKFTLCLYQLDKAGWKVTDRQTADNDLYEGYEEVEFAGQKFYLTLKGG